MVWRHKLVILWLLWAKSLLPFLPVLGILLICMLLGLRKLGWFLFCSTWLGLFLWLVVDVFLVSLTGSHISEFIPNLLDIFREPDKTVFDMAKGDVADELLTVAAYVVSAGIATFCGSLILAKYLVTRFKWMGRPTGLAAATILVIVAVMGVFPVIAVHGDHQALFRRIYYVLPVHAGFLESSTDGARNFMVFVAQLGRTPDLASDSSTGGDSRREDNPNPRIILENHTGEDVSLTGMQIQNVDHTAHPSQMLRGNIKKDGSVRITLPVETPPRSNVIVTSEKEEPPYVVKWQNGKIGPFLALVKRDQMETRSASCVDDQIDRNIATLLDDFAAPKEVDSGAFVAKSGLPNILLVVVESFRSSAVSPDLMSRLHDWSEGGLRMERHYAGSNCTHLGLFSILYGRMGLAYDAILDRKIPPQLCQSLRQSGYQLSCLSSNEFRGWRRIGEFISDGIFDRVSIMSEAKFEFWKNYVEWPEADRRALAEARKILTAPSDRPHVVMVRLVSTHYPYAFDSTFEFHKPCGLSSRLSNREAMATQMSNRYKNAALFTEHELMQLIQALDPKKNTIILTGDHGESLSDDGTIGHASRASEVQMRTPLMMVGPGIRPRQITDPTTHADILPTLLHILAGKRVPVRNCDGRDLEEEGLRLSNEVIIIPGSKMPEILLVKPDQRILYSVTRSDANEWRAVFKDNLDEMGLISLAPVPSAARH